MPPPSGRYSRQPCGATLFLGIGVMHLSSRLSSLIQIWVSLLDLLECKSLVIVGKLLLLVLTYAVVFGYQYLYAATVTTLFMLIGPGKVQSLSLLAKDKYLWTELEMV